MSEMTLRRRASAHDDWRASPLSRWESALGAEELEKLLLERWPEARIAQLAIGETLWSDELYLTERLVERAIIRVPEGAQLEWDQSVRGEGCLARLVELEISSGASVKINRACAGGLVKEIWRVRLSAGARFELRVGAALNGRSSCEISSSAHHMGDGAISEEVCFFALDEKAFASQTASVRIDQGARGAQATQLGKALHASRESQSYLRPWMRIGNDQVSAAHGAACGPADPEQALYLASRGIAPQEAKRALSLAFAKQAFEGSSPEAAERLGAFLEGAL